MKSNRFPLVSAAAALISLAGSRDAAAIQLDFGQTGQDVKAGYIEVSGPRDPAPSNPYVVVSGALSGVTITISSTSVLGFRDRGNWTTANYGDDVDLFEDFLRAGTGTANGPYSTMTIDVGGLLPNTPYEFTLQLYDGGIDGARLGQYSYEITGSGDANPLNNSHSIGFDSAGQGMTLEERAGYSEMLLTSPTGMLQITITQTGGIESSIPLNSLALVAIPEPSSVILASVGAMLMCMPRRRK